MQRGSMGALSSGDLGLIVQWRPVTTGNDVPTDSGHGGPAKEHRKRPASGHNGAGVLPLGAGIIHCIGWGLRVLGFRSVIARAMCT